MGGLGLVPNYPHQRVCPPRRTPRGGLPFGNKGWPGSPHPDKALRRRRRARAGWLCALRFAPAQASPPDALHPRVPGPEARSGRESERPLPQPCSRTPSSPGSSRSCAPPAAAHKQSSEHTPALPSSRHSCAPWWPVVPTLAGPPIWTTCSCPFHSLTLALPEPFRAPQSEAPPVSRARRAPQLEASLTGWLLCCALQVLNRLQAAADLGQKGDEWAHQAHY